jgi:uncharacterized membrane protein YdcZ (DUF606 family)
MNTGWIIPFIILGGALQSCGAAMNGQLDKHVVNPWLASALSFALITFFVARAARFPVTVRNVAYRSAIAEAQALWKFVGFVRWCVER